MNEWKNQRITRKWVNNKLDSLNAEFEIVMDRWLVDDGHCNEKRAQTIHKMIIRMERWDRKMQRKKGKTGALPNSPNMPKSTNT